MEFVNDKFQSEIVFGGEILLRRVKCFAVQNVKYFILDEMLWTGFARTHYNRRLQAPIPAARRILPAKQISHGTAIFHRAKHDFTVRRSPTNSTLRTFPDSVIY